MAHWIIKDGYNTKVYKCSECGSEYHDCIYSPEKWENCPKCKAVFDSVETSEISAIEQSPMKDVVILSIEKYDEMRADLVKLGEDLEVANKDKDHYLDILEMIGFQEKYIDRIVPDSARFNGTERNPVTLNKRVIISFEIREN